MDFTVGLSFTGTVSAGAYTAGVIDFIIDALDEWQKLKDACQANYGTSYDKWEVPWHNVVIKGISGASGGGVSAGLMVNTIGKDFSHVRTPADAATSNNDFYNTWVNNLGIQQLLATDDITGSDIKALLDANALPAIANQLLVQNNFGNTLRRPYIDDNLIAIITLTNLRGIPYILQSKSILRENIIYYRHEDYAKFELARNNSPKYTDAIAVPYDTTLPEFATGYAQLKAACLCTCAFPGAFKAQPFTQQTTVYQNRPFGIDLDPITNPTFSFLASDGGVLNTEPFQLLHDALFATGNADQVAAAQAEEKAEMPGGVTHAVIMVAPLETGDVFDQTYDITQDSLVQIVGPEINAIRQEAIFSAEQIYLALNESIYSRYIITPVRYATEADTNIATPAITATMIANFGAFLSQDFRQHDYFLGRRNAQQFLRYHFAVPANDIADNPVFGPLNIQQQYSNYIFKDPMDSTGTAYFPIIPLCGAAANDTYFPAWPAGKGYSLPDIQNQLTNRVDKLMDAAVGGLGLSWLQKLFIPLVTNAIKSAAVSKAMDAINTGLHDAGLDQ